MPPRKWTVARVKPYAHRRCADIRCKLYPHGHAVYVCLRRLGKGFIPTYQKGTGLFWSVLSGETSRSNGDLLSPVAWKSAALSEVCGKFWTRRAHRGFAIINPQVERLSIYGVVDPSRFYRILQECRRISCGLTAHLPQRRPLPLVESGPKSYE